MQAPPGKCTGLLALLLLLQLPGSGAGSQTVPDPARLPLSGYFEPSGLVQLADGRLIVVEDENNTPISVLTFDEGQGFTGEPVRLETLSTMVSDRTRVGRLNDLEAATLGPDGFVYAISSHSRTPKGKRFPRREKLIRFRLDGNRAVDAALVLSLRDQMAALHGEIAAAARIRDAGDDDHLSVEGMAYDPVGKRLLIGMRGPTIDGLSVVLVLSDLEAAFDGTRPARLTDDLILLDLDKGGIRGMGYDPGLGGFLILSRREKKGKGFKLWLWDGSADQQPRRIRLRGDIDLSKAEGIAPVRLGQRDLIMIVFDSGRKRRDRDGEYLLLSYDQLEIEPARNGTP